MLNGRGKVKRQRKEFLVKFCLIDSTPVPLRFILLPLTENDDCAESHLG